MLLQGRAQGIDEIDEIEGIEGIDEIEGIEEGKVRQGDKERGEGRGATRRGLMRMIRDKEKIDKIDEIYLRQRDMAIRRVWRPFMELSRKGNDFIVIIVLIVLIKKMDEIDEKMTTKLYSNEICKQSPVQYKKTKLKAQITALLRRREGDEVRRG